MILNFFKNLNTRTKYILGITVKILIIFVIASLVLILVFSSIGNYSNLPFLISLAGVCFLIFLISLILIFVFAVVLIFFFLIDAVKRHGFKKLLKRLVPTILLSFIILIAIDLIKGKNIEWLDSLCYSLVITFSSFLYTEIDILKEKLKSEHNINSRNVDDN